MKTLLRLTTVTMTLLLAAEGAVPVPISSSSSFDHQEILSLRWKEITAVLPHAARIPSADGKGKHLWQTPAIAPESLISEHEGRGYLLPLVVTPPAGRHLAMAVCFVSDPGCVPAGLLSPEGEEINTARNFQSAPYWLEDLRWPPANRFGGFWFPAGDLTPGHEHVLLFACHTGAPADLKICVTFLATEPEFYENEWSQISDYLGLKPINGEKMAELAGYRSAKIIAAYPALAMKDTSTPIGLKKLVPGALSLGLSDPPEPWLENRNLPAGCTLQLRQSAWHIDFATDPGACPTRDEMVKLAGEPIISVSLDVLRRHAANPIKKALPKPDFSTDDFDSQGIRVDYYDILAVLTNDASPAKVIGTWTVGDFTGGTELAGYRTFLLPQSDVRAFLIDGKCVGLVGSLGTDEAEQLMDTAPPAGRYIEKTPGGETYAIFECDGKAQWEVKASYPGGMPRFQYHVVDNRLSGKIELWKFGGQKLEAPEKSD